MQEEKHNYKLLVAYDGTPFFGWQKTKTGPSIEESLESTLAIILQERPSLQAASRTDRGVHAEGQVVHFISTQEIDIATLQFKCNRLLPKEIAIKQIEKVHPSFHPTLDSKAKEYRYRICNAPTQLPFLRPFSWHLPHPMNLEQMKLAADALIGTKDFSALSNHRFPAHKTTQCTLMSIAFLQEEHQLLTICMKGDRFLYKMARNLAGLLAAAALGKCNPSEIPRILLEKKRALAPMTAPAHGLLLYEVFY